MNEDVKEEIRRKLLEGKMTEEEWEALEEEDKECILAGVLTNAISVEVENVRRKKQQEGRLAAGKLFNDEDKPPEGSEILLPAGYAINPEGTFKTVITTEKDKKIRAKVIRISRTPFFIAAKDHGTGRVRLMVRVQQGDWRGEWVQASCLTIKKLIDWLIFPEDRVKEKELVIYARASAVVAPFAVAHDVVVQAAVEILMRLFPARAAGVEFPALRAFSHVREVAAELGVDPLAVRRWWERQGFFIEGPGKVNRPRDPKTGKLGKSARMLVFTARVKDFLQSLPDDDEAIRGREGAIFQVKILNGPEAGQEKLIALPHARIVPLGAETPSPLTPLAQALVGRHWPGEVVEVRAEEPYQIQILEIDPPAPEPEQKQPQEQKEQKPQQEEHAQVS